MILRLIWAPWKFAEAAWFRTIATEWQAYSIIQVEVSVK